MADKRVLDPCCGRDVREKLVEIVGTSLDGTLLNITDSVVDCVVDALIAHGVTIPTRCKECRYWTDKSKVKGCDEMLGHCTVNEPYVSWSNDFCSSAEHPPKGE